MSDIWKRANSPSQYMHPLYIAISGNTGAGKTTLVHQLASQLQRHFPSVIAVSEREFHHPFLPLMFSHPTLYALPVQLNFAIQRNLFLMRALHNGHVVVMERSHYDDLMYVEDHRTRGNIGRTESDAYETLSTWFRSVVPRPNIHVLLTISPALSFQRVKADEEAGRRPAEFPDDDTLESYITTWNDRYEAFYAWLHKREKGDLAPTTHYLRYSSEASSSDDIISEVTTSALKGLAWQ